METQTRNKASALGLACILIVVPLALASTAGKPDRLTPLEKVETAKVANDVAQRIVAVDDHGQGNRFTKMPATKRDSLLACSLAHGESDEATSADDKVFSLTTENAQDDPAVLHIAAEMRSQHQFTAFTVAVWPYRGSGTRGTYMVLVRMHGSAETVDKPDKINAACR